MATMKRPISEKFEDYKNRLYAGAMALKRYLKGHFSTVGSLYVPKDPKRSGKFTKKHFNFKKSKSRRLMQKLSRRKNRRG